VQACIALDMLIRLILFLVPAAVFPGKLLHRTRCRGYLRILCTAAGLDRAS
jgi:hypothetical protein